jgi:serine/threonine-protein kinase
MMKHKGPILTIVVGLVLAAVLVGMSVRANNDANLQATADGGAPGGDQTSSAPAPSKSGKGTGSPAPKVSPSKAPSKSPQKSAPPSAAPGGSAEKPAGPPVLYAGRVGSGPSTLAIAVANGKAIAYICDGRAVESWLSGPATGGKLALKGADGTTLSGVFTQDAASGSLVVAGKRSAFTVRNVQRPSGLYRASSTVSGAKVVAGWIVLPGGQQVGLATVDGKPRSVPQLDVDAGKATVDGRVVPVEPANPSA